MSKTKETELWQALPDEQKQWPVLSHSQLRMLDQCGFEWYIGYKLGYTTWEKSEAMTVGTLFHQGAAAYYQAKKDRNVQAVEFIDHDLKAMIEGWMQPGNEEMRYAAHAGWMLQRYLSECEYMDQGHTVLEVEYHFIIPMKTPKGRNVLCQGYVDLITRDQYGRIWVWDHKTGKFWNLIELMMDPQIPLYIVALMELGFENIAGQVVNQINNHPYKHPEKVTNEQMFQRDPLPRSENELINVARGTLTLADEWLDARESDEIPRRSQSRYTCKYCYFAEPCSYSLKGMDLKTVLDVPKYRRKDQDFSHRPDPEDVIIEWGED